MNEVTKPKFLDLQIPAAIDCGSMPLLHRIRCHIRSRSDYGVVALEKVSK